MKSIANEKALRIAGRNIIKVKLSSKVFAMIEKKKGALSSFSQFTDQSDIHHDNNRES